MHQAQTETKQIPDWAYVKRPCQSGQIKTRPQDFKVEEVLGFEPDGAGEHLWLFIEKTGLNTHALASEMARYFGVHPKHIGYSGLKDKQAQTRQWMSIRTARAFTGEDFPNDSVQVLKTARHSSKLKRGTHRANRFELIVRNLGDLKDFGSRIERVKQYGVPNYFGPQRFGRGGQNILKARQMFAQKTKPRRHERSLYLSAARAYLFNQVLSARVEDGSWDRPLAGEAMMLAGSNSFFQCDVIDADLEQRLAAFDIHPSAPLWGKGELASTGEARALETRALSADADFKQGLEQFGLRQQRRACRLAVEGLDWEEISENCVKLRFSLTRAGFATTVLRELLTIDS